MHSTSHFSWSNESLPGMFLSCSTHSSANENSNDNDSMGEVQSRSAARHCARKTNQYHKCKWNLLKRSSLCVCVCVCVYTCACSRLDSKQAAPELQKRKSPPAPPLPLPLDTTTQTRTSRKTSIDEKHRFRTRVSEFPC